MNDCEAYGHPNVTGEGCPCGLIVTTLPPPSAWPPEPPLMLMHLARQPQRPHRRPAPKAAYRPRPHLPPPRVQQIVYP